jgi:hypothetical protein
VLNGGDTGESVRPATAGTVQVRQFLIVSEGFVWNADGFGAAGVEASNTLLGPEATSDGCDSESTLVPRQQSLWLRVGTVAVWVWCWLRIAQWMRASFCLMFCVVKLLRAYGGCLGTRSR